MGDSAKGVFLSLSLSLSLYKSELLQQYRRTHMTPEIVAGGRQSHPPPQDDFEGVPLAAATTAAAATRNANGNDQDDDDDHDNDNISFQTLVRVVPHLGGHRAAVHEWPAMGQV